MKSTGHTPNGSGRRHMRKTAKSNGRMTMTTMIVGKIEEKMTNVGSAEEKMKEEQNAGSGAETMTAGAGPEIPAEMRLTAVETGTGRWDGLCWKR
jgi:hypothetical protein